MVRVERRDARLAWLRARVLDLIEETFGQVTREGGVSWSEAAVLDDYGSEEEQAKARASDKDKKWRELVRHPDFRIDFGNFAFLDPIGFRYYLPAVLVEAVESGYDNGIGEVLVLPRGDLRKYSLKQWSLLDPSQKNSVRHVLKYMSRVDPDDGWWASAYQSYWRVCHRDVQVADLPDYSMPWEFP